MWFDHSKIVKNQPSCIIIVIMGASEVVSNNIPDIGGESDRGRECRESGGGNPKGLISSDSYHVPWI